MCSFHGCIHNLTLNGDVVNLEGLAESDPTNNTRLPLACPADIDSLSLPCLCHGNWSSGCYQNQSLNTSCLSDPCESYSTCVPTIFGGYTCLCPPGSTGDHCELPECPLPCMHGGTCTWGALCLCVEGRTGTQCETDINECASSPCVNGGTCYESGQTVQAFGPGYVCRCPRSYHGTNCELSVCDGLPCGQGGRCLPDDDDRRGYRCDCLLGFEGPRCDRDLRLCASSPCHSDSTCVNSTSSNDYTCLCSPGFTGNSLPVTHDLRHTFKRQLN